jgi:hypothetical protein
VTWTWDQQQAWQCGAERSMTVAIAVAYSRHQSAPRRDNRPAHGKALPPGFLSASKGESEACFKMVNVESYNWYS